MIRLFATESVREEVEEHLLEVAAGRGLPTSAVDLIWRSRVAPAVNFVALEARPPLDVRVATLAAADFDDAPTGSLAELLVHASCSPPTST